MIRRNNDDEGNPRRLLAIAAPVLAEAQSITVDAKHQIARVPRRLFGTNVRQNMESDGKIRHFLKETGVTLFRYPDSVDSGYTWDWDAGGVIAHDGKPMTSKLARLDTGNRPGGTCQGGDFLHHEDLRLDAGAGGPLGGRGEERGVGSAYWCLGNEPYFPGDKLYLPAKPMSIWRTASRPP